MFLRDCFARPWQDGQPPSGAGVSFYLDGAHTPESIAECAKWFASVAGAPAEAAPAAPRPYNVLLFYTMQKRNPVEILSPLHSTLAAKVRSAGPSAVGTRHEEPKEQEALLPCPEETPPTPPRPPPFPG